MNKRSVYKFAIGAAIAMALVTIILLLMGNGSEIGPFLVLFFVFLAIGVRISSFLSSFSYTMWIFAAVTVSMFYPQYFLQIGDFQLKNLIVPLLQIIMFGMGSQMSFKDFAGVIKMPKGVLVGVICQFTIMPFIGFTIASTFGFAPEVAAGIILIGSSPSGLASNVMSFIAKANLALSVTLTAIATLLAPLLTPTLMKWLAGEFVPVDFWDMMLGIINMIILPIVAGLIFNAIAYGRETRKSIIIQAIAYLVIIGLKNYIFLTTTGADVSSAMSQFYTDLLWFLILPIIGGLLFKHLAGGRKEYLDKVLAFVSMAGIAVIITIITASGRDDLLQIGFLLILASLIHNLAGYTLGYWFSKLVGMDEKSCRTIALEVGMQNGGLASGIAVQMGKIGTVGLAPAVFGPLMNITGSSLATWWRGRPVGDTEKIRPGDVEDKAQKEINV
ncbi:MAG: bile acid:sodium symporter family protein [Candidatus Cyclobacteriaceae bacterium M3_2C_046]